MPRTPQIHKDEQKKKSSKKGQLDEDFFKKLHSINFELKEITGHDAKIDDLDRQRERFIIGDSKLFKEHILCIIETVNKLEDNYVLEK